jgi:hypothetical protein
MLSETISSSDSYSLSNDTNSLLLSCIDSLSDSCTLSSDSKVSS